MCRSLRKPTLAGLRVHQGEVVGKGIWEPILTEDDHKKLVARMERVRQTYGRLERPGPEPKHLLSLIAKCGEPGCGKGLARRRNSRGTSVYVCPKSHCSRLAEPLDRAVEKELFDRLSRVNPEHFEGEGDDSVVDALWAEVAELERQLEEWTEKAIAGDVTPTSFAKIEQGLNRRIEDMKAQAVQGDNDPIDLADLLENWDDMPVREKRAAIRGFFTVTVHPAKRGTRVGLGGVEITPL
jgi:hypothetical protein